MLTNWRLTAPEQQLRQHEEQNRPESRRFTLEAIIFPVSNDYGERSSAFKITIRDYLKLLCVAKAGFDNLLM